MRTIDELGELTELATSTTETYIRYSAGPAADAEHPSRDYEADLDLPGLPVTTLRPEPWWRRDPIDWVSRRVCKYIDLADRAPDRRPWVLTGEVVGYGPDHEPLIGAVQPLAWIGEQALEQASRRYHERFDVGRDSTGHSRRT